MTLEETMQNQGLLSEPESGPAFAQRHHQQQGRQFTGGTNMSAASHNEGVVGFWDVANVVEPDFILPEQFQSRDKTRTGEFGLLWAVFTDGIQTYCREVLRGATNGLVFREVERWIFRPDSDAITSFSNLCELFDIDPRRLRRGLLRFRENPSSGVLEVLKANAA